MKQSIYILFLVLFFNQCQSEKNQTELAELLKQQKQLQADLSKINSQIAALTETSAHLPRVKVQKLEKTNFEHFIRVQGTAKSDYALELYPEIGGKVTQIFHKEGEFVQKGKVIIALDTKVADAQIQEIKANLELVTLNFDKQSLLFEQGVGTELEYKKWKTDKETLSKKLEMAILQKEKSLIIAPFAGTIDKIYTKIGELTGSQMPLARVVDLQKIKLEAQISEVYLGKIQEGNKVNVFFPAIDYTLADQKVSHVGRFVQTQNRTFNLEIELENKDKKIYPNLVAKIDVADFQVDDALVIPAKSILYNNKGESYVFILENNLVRKKIIKIGLEYNQQQLVLEGLSIGDQLITDGFQALSEGDQVKILE